MGRGVLTAPRPWAMCWPGALRTVRPNFVILLSLLIAAFAAQARINVVTLPDRDTVQLTIYNSVDLTLVKETRHLTFRKGLNKLEFSWANTLIDPTSVEFRALTHGDEVEVLDASFPPRAPNTLEWRINSEFAGDFVVNNASALAQLYLTTNSLASFGTCPPTHAAS